MLFFPFNFLEKTTHLDGGLVGGDDCPVGVGDESVGPRGQGGGGAVGAQAVRAVAGGGGGAGGQGQEGELREQVKLSLIIINFSTFNYIV